MNRFMFALNSTIIDVIINIYCSVNIILTRVCLLFTSTIKILHDFRNNYDIVTGLKSYG